MSQPPLVKSKKQSRISNNTLKNNSIFPPFKSIKSILKEKLLYSYLCNIHHSNYFKYCISCKKDICFQCEKESHINHEFINYENILPDINEINIIQKALKDYEKNFSEFINIINCWKKDFDNTINDYQKHIKNVMEYVNKFSNEKNNFNSIYKFRSICSLILDYNNNIDINDKIKEGKNTKITELMKNLLIEKDKGKNKDYNDDNNYINRIQKDYKSFLSHNYLIKIINSINNYSLLDKIKKIISIIDYKNENMSNNLQTNFSKRNSDTCSTNFIETPNLTFYKNYNNKSSYGKSNTAETTFNKNFYIPSSKEKKQNQKQNQKGKESSAFQLNQNIYYNKEGRNSSKSTNNIYFQNNQKTCVYERKKIKEKNNEQAMLSITDNFENLKSNTFREKIIENYKYNNNIKNPIQESINNTKINTYLYDNYINNNCIHKMIKRKRGHNIRENRNQNLVNRALLYNYKGFDINDKDSGPELLSNSSYTIQGVKYNSNSLRSSSLEHKPSKFKYLISLGRVSSNTINSNSFEKKNYTIRMDRKHSFRRENNTLNERGYQTVNNTNLIAYINHKTHFSRNHAQNAITCNNNSFNNSLVNFFKRKMNNSVLNIYRNNMNNSLIRNKSDNNTINNINNTNNNNEKNKEIICNQIYNNNKQKKIYVHKKYTQFDEARNLSYLDSTNNSIFSSFGKNKENNLSSIEGKYNNINNDIHINGNKPLLLGLELGNNECRIGVINKNNYFELFNLNNNYTIPTIISFVHNNIDINNPMDISNIKIGEEAEQIKILNAHQTIFNIIKLIGKNNNEIVGRKDLWPFMIYNDEKTNKPYIRIKSTNKSGDNKFIYYNFEDILTIFLKKLFQKFFNKIIIDKFDESDIIKSDDNCVNINKVININIVISVPNYYNYLQRKIIENIFVNELFPKIEVSQKDKTLLNSNIYGKYIIKLKNIKIENVSNLASFYLINKNKEIINTSNNLSNTINNINKIPKNSFTNSLNYLILYIEGSSINISVFNLKKNIIEIKAINGSEFGEEDFIDSFICSCLSDFKDKIRKNCLTSPVALAKLRKSLNIVRKCFNKDDIVQTEVNINKLYDNIDLRMTLNKNDYIKSCIGLFRKVIYLIKETIINSGVSIKNIYDIILIGNITENTKLRNMMSEIFKDNKKIYDKLTKKIVEKDTDSNNYIIKGAIMQCLNNNMVIPKYKFINISSISFGIETLNGLMEIVVEKGTNIPIKINKYIKIKKPGKNDNNLVNINIYEGDNKYVKNNKLISRTLIDINNFKNEKKDENNIEILFQFFIDSYYNLNVFILDKNNLRRKFECLINMDYIKN